MPTSQAATDQVQDEVARLLAIQLRLQLGNQAQAIIEMSKGGFPNSRIAALLGTSTDTVKVTVQRAKKATAPKAKAKRTAHREPEAQNG